MGRLRVERTDQARTRRGGHQSWPVGWGFYITLFVFWVGIAHSGTLISAVLFLFRVRWRSSIYRSAEAVTVFAVATAGLFPLIHLGRPWVAFWLLPYPQMGGLFPNFRSPLVWDVFAVSTYLTVSAIFFFTGMVPDLAIVRDRSVGWREKFYGFFAQGWQGTEPAVAALHVGVRVPGRARDAARDFRPQHRLLGLRDVGRARLAHHDFPALLRRGRHTLRPRHGDDHRDSHAAAVQPASRSSRRSTWPTWPSS